MMFKRYDISLFTISMLLLAASLVSCEKEKVGPTHETTPIEFGNVETRAVVESAEIMKTTGFGVFGYVSDVNDPLFENDKVFWDGSVWTYGEPEYWIPDHIFHFFAYYPYSTAETADYGVSGVQALDGNSGFKLNFITPGTADFDLLSTYKSVDTGSNDFDASAPVPMNFGHEMVNVNLKIWRDYGKHQNDKMKVKDVSLSNVAWGGTLTKTAESATWQYSAPKNDISRVVAGYEIGAATREGSGLTTGGTPAMPFGDAGLLLIPQPAGNITLRIVYELWLSGAGEDGWNEYILETTLPPATWTAGSRITYNVLLSNIVDITFYYISTSVTPWGTPQVGGTIIIK